MTVITMQLVCITIFLAHLGLILAGKGEKTRRQDRPRSDRSNKYIKFEDCGMDPDRPVWILNVTATPRIIRYPGRVKVSADMLVTRPLPQTLSADVIITKFILGHGIKLPCVKNLGSCHYKQLCEWLLAYYGGRCPRRLRRQNVSCSCPFNSGSYGLRNMRFDIPAFEGMWSLLANGQYEIMVRLYNDTNNDELSCLKFNFHLTNRRRHNDHRRRRRHKYTRSRSRIDV